MEVLGLSPFSEKQRVRMVETILSIVDDTGLAPRPPEVGFPSISKEPVPARTRRSKSVQL
jgi:hypothetical protein